jgi:hypothetical protein
MCDTATSSIADALHIPFKAIGKELSKDYGGIIENLWIDFELIRSQRSPKSFRFQKRVSGKAAKYLTGLSCPDDFNVGHYSVKPNFNRLLKIPLGSVADYALSLIYESTSILIKKQNKLGGFNVIKFRSDFLSACKNHGFHINIINSAP